MPSYAPAKPKAPRRRYVHPFNIEWRVRATDAIAALDHACHTVVDEHFVHYTSRAIEILRPVRDAPGMTNARARELFKQAGREISYAFHLSRPRD
ncbi:MAG: hypothetical protein GX856_13940 [Gammaproteobacteria bacterium]|nr:hypothetical protein [Gammaproteobacteria bacterium]